MRKPLLAGLLSLTVVASVFLSGSARAQSPLACELLAALKIENVNLLSATKVEATADLPSHCRVLGYVRPAINFETRLPVRGLRARSSPAVMLRTDDGMTRWEYAFVHRTSFSD